MAVGNFKRSAGHIFPEGLPDPSPGFVAPPNFVIPGLPRSIVVRDTPASWRNLTEVSGLGVPTATTLLSALWPGYHVIIDIRASRAAVGVTAGARWDTTNRDHCALPLRNSKEEYWTFYGWYRPIVVASTSRRVQPVQVERALYVLDGRTMRRLPSGRDWTWSDYRAMSEYVLAGMTD
jgi:hypothetical protein